MKKRFLACFLLTFFYIVLLPAVSFAEDRYVFDKLELVSDRDSSALEKRIAAIKNAYNFNVVIVIDENIAQEDVVPYGDDFYEKNGFSGNGILLTSVWALETGNFWGWGVNTFGEIAADGKDAPLINAVQANKHLNQFLFNNPYIAYSAFIDDVEQFLNPATPKNYVNDGAHLLSDGQINALKARIAAIKNAYNFDVVIVTEDNVDGAELKEYADDFFNSRNGGFGNGNGGVLLLQVLAMRDYYIRTFGQGEVDSETIFTDHAMKETLNHVLAFLQKDDHYGAYNAFIDDMETYLSLAAKDGRHTVSNEWLWLFIVIAVVAALLIAVIIVSVRKKTRMDTNVNHVTLTTLALLPVPLRMFL